MFACRKQFTFALTYINLTAIVRVNVHSMTQSTPTDVYIRRATQTDSPTLSRICLLTGDAGVSAEPLHDYGELIGLMWAEPYVHLPAGFGFVLVDPSQNDAVVGYLLGTYDTRLYESQADESWFPKWRAKYPLSTDSTADPPVCTLSTDPSKPLRDADARYIKMITNPPHAPENQVAFSPAHLHIDILPAYQRQGWGRKLIGEAIRYLREEQGLERLWLRQDPRNENGRKFYGRLGFVPVEGAAEGVMGLDFKDFK